VLDFYDLDLNQVAVLAQRISLSTRIIDSLVLRDGTARHLNRPATQKFVPEYA
jgi:hypothetical protein